MSNFDYDALYRKLHPRSMPFSPYERQRELRDLWPVDQQKFRDFVDAVLSERNAQLDKFAGRLGQACARKR